MPSFPRRKPVRVLIVDDDAIMRVIIEGVLESDPEIEVVGTAGGAAEARQAIKALEPDVVTLDVEMPDMNGLDFLEKIMQLHPMPVVMVSGRTTEGADATIRAMEAGAIDCVAKPSPGNHHVFEDLAAIVKIAATARLRPRPPRRPPAPRAIVQTPTAPAYGARVVAIGSSTGGVDALIEVLSAFPADCPPTVIVQHMPANFTTSMAARLDRLSAPRVREAVDGQGLEPGCVHLAPGAVSHLEVVDAHGLRCRLRPGEPVNNHRPSVDVLFASVARAAGADAVGVILTGMGGDGAAGLLAMRRAGAHARTGPGEQRDLRHAEGRVRTRGGGAATAAGANRPRDPRRGEAARLARRAAGISGIPQERGKKKSAFRDSFSPWGVTGGLR